MSTPHCLKKEEIKESEAELDGGDCDVEGENSDPTDNVSLAARQQTWWPATCTAEVKDFEQLVEPSHSLPVNVQPLGCFFLFLS